MSVDILLLEAALNLVRWKKGYFKIGHQMGKIITLLKPFQNTRFKKHPFGSII